MLSLEKASGRHSPDGTIQVHLRIGLSPEQKVEGELREDLDAKGAHAKPPRGLAGPLGGVPTQVVQGRKTVVRLAHWV
jgi:hypothetical protein